MILRPLQLDDEVTFSTSAKKRSHLRWDRGYRWYSKGKSPYEAVLTRVPGGTTLRKQRIGPTLPHPSTTSIRLLALCSPTCTARTTQPKKLEAKWSALFVLCRRGSMIDQLCTLDGESTTEGIRKMKNSF